MDIKQRAQLGIDGNCGFALIGEDLQSGEAEFVEIPHGSTVPDTHHERYTQETRIDSELSGKLWACKEANRKLRERLGCPELIHYYYFGPSHPYGN